MTKMPKSKAELPQPTDPAIPLSLYSKPVARGRCCGTLGCGLMH
jgi:hypothetical protein